jgi:hypothetical protein
MMLNRLFIASVVSLSAMTLAACQSDSKAADSSTPALATINDHCPVLGFKKVKADAPVAQYKGQRIGFCCDKCPAKWDSWSEQKKDAFVARQTK